MRIAYAVLGLLLVGYLISEIIRKPSDTSTLVDGWGVVVFEVVAGGLCFARAFLTRTNRSIVLMLGLGLACWTLGDIILTAEPNAPSPGLQDAFYIAFYPVTYVGLMLMMRRQVKRFSIATWFDGAIAGVGAAAICAAFAFHGLLKTAGGSGLAVAVNLAYPIGDTLLVGLVVAGCAVLSGRRRAPWLMIAAGYSLVAVGDTFNLFSSGIGSTHIGVLFNAVA